MNNKKKMPNVPSNLEECKLKQQDAIFHLSDGQRFKKMLILTAGKSIGSGYSH